MIWGFSVESPGFRPERAEKPGVRKTIMGVREMKRCGIRVKRRICLVIVLLLFLFTLCAVFSAGHECSGLHCPICALLHLSGELVCLLSLCWLADRLPPVFGRLYPGRAWDFLSCRAPSPVGDHVKLSS